jgi:hypothetical protein
MTTPVTCTMCNEARDPLDVCASCRTCTYNGCCACWTCPACTNPFPGTTAACNNCGNCPTDCRCVNCPACNRRTQGRHIHADCQRCENCCHCGEIPPRIEHVAPPRQVVFHDATPGLAGHKTNPSKRYIAAEIEVANVNEKGLAVSEVIRKWKGGIVRDGSIEGETPFEINTAPASGDKYVEEINEICAALKNAKAQVNKTCGLHVHVDCRDFNFYDIRKLAILYSKIEEALFQIVAPSRKTSRFCRPCGAKYVKDLENNIIPKDNEKALIKNVYGYEEKLANIRANGKYNEARYAAMNIHSWIFRGTIECRTHQGTVSAKKIKMWGLLWAGIVDYSFDNTEKFIRGIKGNSMDILLSVCPTEEVRAWVMERAAHFKTGATELNGETDANE